MVLPINHILCGHAIFYHSPQALYRSYNDKYIPAIPSPSTILPEIASLIISPLHGLVEIKVVDSGISLHSLLSLPEISIFYLFKSFQCIFHFFICPAFVNREGHMIRERFFRFRTLICYFFSVGVPRIS